MKKIRPVLLAIVSTFGCGAALACASCGCTLNSDWGSQGLASSPGWSLDLRYDMLDQNQLRSGTGTIAPTVAALTANPSTGNAAEVEKFTNNRYLTATLDYNHGDTWGINLVIPYIDRAHSTLGVGSDGITADPSGYESQSSGIGDIRVVGRYYGFTQGGNLGVQLGLKLPTGATSQMSKDGSVAVDPGLQLGSGSTDLIVGAYYFDNLNQDWDYFTNIQFQSALTNGYMSNGGNGGYYRPGDSVNLSGGVRYHGLDSFTPELQLNARVVNADSGSPGLADTWATGGTLVYLTPGASVAVSEKLSLHASVQLPIYQNVNGIQLVPTSIFSVGARYTF